jgi:hypothetical protein
VEEIQEVIRDERPKNNLFLEQVAKEKERWERERQKEKELFERWMKEQMAKAEKEIEKRLQVKRLGSVPATIPEEDEGEAGKRLSRWASQISPSVN